MAPLSLYRAHRPETFDDVIGQPEIVASLSAAAERGTPAHAYLFAGSRGLGKTSLARIFARALGTTDKDLYEIDAASHNSVEHIRALTESVHTLPFESSFKVYILDEAHMLSKSAWNAFLKTLEEPPPHVVFILATTERDRVPDTVGSRCQVFSFRKPQRTDLEVLLTRVAEKEGLTLEPDAVELVATLADGSYRDALSVLGALQAACGDGPITREAAERATGAPARMLVNGYLGGLVRKDPAAAIAALTDAARSGHDLRVFASLALSAARDALLAKHAPEIAAPGSTDPSTAAAIDHRVLAALLDAYARVPYAPVPEIPLELAAYELAAS